MKCNRIPALSQHRSYVGEEG